MVVEQFMVNIILQLLSEIYGAEEIPAVLKFVSKNFQIVVHLDGYESIWFKLGMLINTMDSTFDIGLNELDLNSRLQGYERAKPYALVSSITF